MKKILSVIMVVIVIWIGALIIEYLKYHSFESGDI